MASAHSAPQQMWGRHARKLLDDSKQETLNVLHLRFTEGNDDLEKLEASLSHKIELTDVPVFDNVYSFQKLAVLQESGCQIDVLALTGIQDSDEQSKNLQAAFLLLKQGGQCWVSASQEAVAAPSTLKIYSFVSACNFEVVDSCSPESGGINLVAKLAGSNGQDAVPVPAQETVCQVDGVLIDEDPDYKHIPEDTDMANYYDYKEIYPGLEFLKENYDTLLEEVQSVKHWVPWPEDHYSPGSEWKVLPFVYTFPANDPSKTKWISRCCGLCPKTTALLEKVPGIRTALFSRLGPHTSLHLHRGWSDLSNHVLRCHIGLQVPAQEQGCGLWVNGEIVYHANKKIIVFDDSKIHKAFNNTEEDRMVLIIDCQRPDHIESGRAKGGHTAELDSFISKFTKFGEL